jgi:hypothetical protein
MPEDVPKEEPSPEPTQKASLTEEIKSAVKEVLGSLLDSGEVKVSDDKSPRPADEGKPPGPREEERSMEELVRAEVEKLKQQTPSEPTKASSPAETPPNSLGQRIQKALWGTEK